MSKTFIRIVGAFLLLGVCLWLLDVAVDYFLFGEYITEQPMEKIFDRSMVVFVCLISGIVAAGLYEKHRRAAIALQNREQEFRDLIDNAADLITQVDSSGRFIYVNNASETFFGLPKEECTGRLAFDFVHPEDREKTRQAFTGWVCNRLASAAFENRQVNQKTGQARLVSWTATLHFDNEGNAAIINSIGRDITEPRRAENALQESEEKWRNLFENSLFGIVICEAIKDNSGKIADFIHLELNQASQIHVGWNIKKIKGKRAREIASPNELENLMEACNRIAVTGKPERFREYYPTYDRTLDISLFPLNKGLFALTFQDVTGEIAAEKELNKHREHLEQLVGERTKELARRVEEVEQLNAAMVNLAEDLQKTNASLESTSSQLKAANKELEAFSYSVSHDLRAPLRAIDGFSQAILEDYDKVLDDVGKKYLNRIRAGCSNMSQLIDDMLRLSQVTRAEIKREKVSLSDMVTEIFDTLKEHDPARNVELKAEGGIHAYTDRNLIHAVLENLLGNAWKFTRNEPAARIEFGKTRHNGKEAFFVRDNGAGFDMRYVDRLFGAFQRLHGKSEFEGTGIGLATVQRIINRFGGEVWAEGQVNNGATFYFTL